MYVNAVAKIPETPVNIMQNYNLSNTQKVNE